MPTRHSGQIQMVSKCKSDTSANSNIRWIISRTSRSPLTISVETTIQSHSLSLWETFQTALTFKWPLWMIELRVDRLISMTAARSNSCKIESSSWMTGKVLVKGSTKLKQTNRASESPPSTTCRSLIQSRVVLSNDKDSWTRNRHYSISSFSIMKQPWTPSPLKAPALARFRSIQLITPRFNTDCFQWAKTSLERVLRTSLIVLTRIGNLSRLILGNSLTSFIRMSIKVQRDL